MLANETKEFVFHDLTTNNPALYDIVPIINSKALTDYLIPVLSIPNTPESLKEYLKIYPNILGDYQYDLTGNPNNNYVPNGIKFVLPFAVENHLNIDLNLESCISVEGSDKIYYKINDNYYESETKSICNTHLLNTDEKKIIESIIELNIGGMFASGWDNIFYKLKYDDFVLFEDYTQILVENYKYIPRYNNLNFGNIVTDPIKGLFEPFTKNTSYNINLNFKNFLFMNF